MEFSLQNMLHIFRVRRDDGSTGAEPGQDYGPGRGHGQEVRVPVQEMAPVSVEGHEAADDWVRRRPIFCWVIIIIREFVTEGDDWER